MGSTIIVSIVLTFVTAAISVAVFFAATHAARIQAEAASRSTRETVDAAAYERAKQIYESAIDQLEQELTRMRSRLLEFEQEVNLLRGQVAHLERANSDMRVRLDNMRNGGSR